MTNNRPFSSIGIVLMLFVSPIPPAIAGTVPPYPPKRISSKLVDLGRVYPIYMVAGMATLIELPGPVTGIRTGNPDSIRYNRPERPENEVTVVLQNQNAKPTNLILRSGSKKYVFDIVPSMTTHQDTLEVIGDFGGAALDNPDMELIDSSESKSMKPDGAAKK